MTRDQAERKIEAKKQFVNLLAEEMQDTINKHDFNDKYWIRNNSRTRLKALMRMLRKETLALEVISTCLTFSSSTGLTSCLTSSNFSCLGSCFTSSLISSAFSTSGTISSASESINNSSSSSSKSGMFLFSKSMVSKAFFLLMRR